MMKKNFENIGIKAQKAFLRKIDTRRKDKVLNKYQKLILINQNKILKENYKDIKLARKNKIKKNLIKRLLLNKKKIDEIRKSIISIIKIKDPVNLELEKWKRPNGLIIKRVSIPLGVIGVIYESRPNVTADVSSLCFKSGNPVILRGGTEAFNTNKILSNLFRKSLKSLKIDENYVQFIQTKNRKAVDYLLSKMKNYIDIIIPRGGKSLVNKVQKLSVVPTIGHLEGLCHTFIDKDADLKMALNILINAKLRNTAICGATETILISKGRIRKFAKPIIQALEKNKCQIYADNKIRKFAKPIIQALEKNKCQIYADNKIRKIYKGSTKIASEKNWKTEYLSACVSIKSVKDIFEAVDHINKYGTMHTDAIVTNNKNNARFFVKNVKSSIAMHNTSTQFADGGEFGFGGEVGISTNKLPPRGPIGLNQLVSYKYEVFGKGQIRE